MLIVSYDVSSLSIMVSRRNVLGHVARLGACSATAGFCLHARAVNPSSVGCIDSADYAAIKVDGRTVQVSNHKSRIPIYQSDDRQLDSFIWEACRKISRVFGVLPEIGRAHV